jgi:hypothetical protein
MCTGGISAQGRLQIAKRPLWRGWSVLGKQEKYEAENTAKRRCQKCQVIASLAGAISPHPANLPRAFKKEKSAPEVPYPPRGLGRDLMPARAAGVLHNADVPDS